MDIGLKYYEVDMEQERRDYGNILVYILKVFEFFPFRLLYLHIYMFSYPAVQFLLLLCFCWNFILCTILIHIRHTTYMSILHVNFSMPENTHNCIFHWGWFSIHTSILNIIERSISNDKQFVSVFFFCVFFCLALIPNFTFYFLLSFVCSIFIFSFFTRKE